MPKQERIKTKYPGVYYILGKSITSNKSERIYYIQYRKNGKLIEEKAGKQFQNAMSAAKASNIRSLKIDGYKLTNLEQRQKGQEINLSIRAKWTIERLWDEYLCRKISYKSIKTDENRFKNHIQPLLGNKEPHEITPGEIDSLILKLSKTLQPQTVKHVLVLLRKIINFGISKNLSKGLNFKIEMPKVNNLKTEDLTPEQISNLFDAIEADPNIDAGNMMKLALYTGMRRGEMFRLKWKDIDYQRGFINICDPKGGANQKIPLNDLAKKVFEVTFKNKSPYVFPGRNGKQRTDIKQPLNRIKKRAGLPDDFRPLHGLRHVYASMLASSGKVDLYTLQKLLTHKSPQMTQRYAHLRDSALKKASDLTGQLINEALESVKTNKKRE